MAALYGFVKLECISKKLSRNHHDLKSTIYFHGLQAALQKLHDLQVQPASNLSLRKVSELRMESNTPHQRRRQQCSVTLALAMCHRSGIASTFIIIPTIMRKFPAAHQVVLPAILLLLGSGVTLAQRTPRPAVELMVGMAQQTGFEQTTYTGIYTSASIGAEVSRVFTLLFGIGYSSGRLDRQDQPYMTYPRDTSRLDIARMYNAGSGSLTIGATVKIRLIADSSAQLAPYFHGKFGGYDSWHTSLHIGQGLNDYIKTGDEIYFGGGFGIDYLPRPETALFVELTILSGQSNYPGLNLLTISAGTRISL